MTQTSTQASIPPVSFQEFGRDFQGFSQKLGDSFARYGFAVLADHGLPQDRVDAAIAATKAFFALSDQVKRAYVIGDVTDGNMELLWGYDFEDGSRAWIAHEAFRPLNHPEVNWEVTGIIPDQVVTANWDEVTPETDPALAAALQYFDELP